MVSLPERRRRDWGGTDRAEADRPSTGEGGQRALESWQLHDGSLIGNQGVGAAGAGAGGGARAVA